MPADETELPDGFQKPDALPDLSAEGAGRPQTDERQRGAGAPTMEQSEGFAMKQMAQEYIEGEKNVAGRAAKVDGRNVDLREKEWMRERYNEQQRQRGGKEIDAEAWARHEATAGTVYMNDEQSAEHRVVFEASGDNGTGRKNARLNGDSVQRDKPNIFVMDGEGEVFAKGIDEAHDAKVSGGEQAGHGAHVHHSSFKAGEQVAGAGEFSVDGEGYLKEVTDRSGHYKPGEEQTSQTLEHLESEKGVNLDNVKFTQDRGQEKTAGMAREYLQGKATASEVAHRKSRIAKGSDISPEPKGAMEQTFRSRHRLADEVKESSRSVRDVLDGQAEKRAQQMAQSQDVETSAGRSTSHAQANPGQAAARAETEAAYSAGALQLTMNDLKRERELREGAEDLSGNALADGAVFDGLADGYDSSGIDGAAKNTTQEKGRSVREKLGGSRNREQGRRQDQGEGYSSPRI